MIPSLFRHFAHKIMQSPSFQSVKTMQKCQNNGGFKMSKCCRYVTTLQVYYVKIMQVLNNFGRTRIHFIFILLIIERASNSYPNLECSQRLIEQNENVLLCDISKNWSMYSELTLLALPACFLTNCKTNLLRLFGKICV